MEDQTQTEMKTMWSETLLETLYVAMEKNKPDNVVRGVLKDLREKGYQKDYLVEKVEKKVGPAAAARLQKLFAGGSGAGGGQARQSSATVRPASRTAKKPEGMVGKLKGFFK